MTDETTPAAAPPEESGRSSISLKRNPSSGNVEVGVKVYVTAVREDGTLDEGALEEANALALRLFRENTAAYPMVKK